MSSRTRTLPCTVTAADLEARSLHPPPWLNKPISVPPGYSLTDVEWIPISCIKPGRQDRFQTDARPMVAPGLSYPALILGAKGGAGANTVVDGHHRYFVLLDQGWRGRVPVVHSSERWLHHLGR